MGTLGRILASTVAGMALTALSFVLTARQFTPLTVFVPVAIGVGLTTSINLFWLPARMDRRWVHALNLTLFLLAMAGAALVLFAGCAMSSDGCGQALRGGLASVCAGPLALSAALFGVVTALGSWAWPRGAAE